MEPKVFDNEALLAYFDQDLEFVLHLLNVFAQESTGRIAGIRQAVEKGDMEVLYLQAHSLKGSADNAKAPALSELADRLARAARAGQAETAAALAAKVDDAYADVAVAVATWRAAVKSR